MEKKEIRRSINQKITIVTREMCVCMRVNQVAKIGGGLVLFLVFVRAETF